MVTNAQLREKLIEVIKQQGKPYGLLIDDIAGGFTLTGRGQPQAFQVEPLVVYKVFADGKPDELVRGVDIVGTPLASLAKIIATGDTPEVFNGYCGAESGSVPVSAVSPAILTTELEVQKKPCGNRPAADFAGASARRGENGRPSVMRTLRFAAILFASSLAPAAFAQAPADNDHTMQAMKDEMARAKSRLELQITKGDKPVRPYFIEYRLLDMDVREVVGEFGALLNSNHNRSRIMDVNARVGDYKLDSSNFVGEDAFRGFIGSNGTVGIDRDYDSLRQDLWIATDQAFKEAVETYSRKQAYLSSLARQSDIDDFAKVETVQHVEPLATSDWSNRNWEQEARDASSALRAFPLIYESRVTYYLVYTTEYLLTSEGTEVRANHSFAAIEGGMNALAKDGMQVAHYYSTYAPRPADLPSVDEVKKGLNVAGSELMAIRTAAPAPDYTGPVLFESRAAAALVAEVLGPSLSGARPPLAFQPVVDQLMSSLGARSDWSGKVDSRVLPATVSLIDDPGAKDYKGTLLVGGYAIDQEGVPGQKVTIVDGGKLKDLLMSRRPGPDFGKSNGHGALLVSRGP